MKNKLTKLITDEKSKWVDDSEYFEENKLWLEKSALIAVKVLRTLRAKSITQKELASKVGVTPQYINKVVKGKENLTLETISKIENALDITLVSLKYETTAGDIKTGNG